MAPALAKEAADKISEQLCLLSPSHIPTFQEQRAKLGQKLDSVDALIHDLLLPHKGKRFYVFHPAFGHFASAYGLQQVAIETEGHEPSPQEIVKLLEQVADDEVRTLLVQPQFTAKEVETMADELGAAIVEIDPLSPDYLQNLVSTASRIADALSVSKEQE